MDQGMAKAARIVVASGAAVGAVRILRRRRRDDPVHAPGKRHRGPAPGATDPHAPGSRRGHDQPWVRRSHSDSQSRRFRR